MEPVRYEVNQVVYLKKAHPCGSNEWLIMRTGIDFGIKCRGCGHFVMMPRKTFEKAVKAVVSPSA